jgi:glycosyltransferase involved in cell wall biosynthesis
MMSLAFIALEVHRRGGQERAAAEVLTRLAPHVELSVVANVCELPGVAHRFVQVGLPTGPTVVRTMRFASAATRAARDVGATLTQSIGAAAREADVITAQFCQAAFTKRFGGLRGSGALRRVWQRAAQLQFVASERHAYQSGRLRRVIAVSTGVGRELHEEYGVPMERITVIPNGVDHAVFRPLDGTSKRLMRMQLALPSDQCIALFIGGDWERKGVRDAITAVAGIPDTMLVIVGAGDQEPMRQHAARVGATAQVRFAGMSTEPEKWYQAADYLLFPSRYEAFSLVTLEAAACGLPIIAHRINGTEDLIRDGENGYLSELGPDALRVHVQRFRDDQIRRRQMSEHAVVVSKRYAWDRIATEQLAVLHEVSA